MRAENTAKNMKYSSLSQVLSLIMQFITRTVFIKVLGSEYLGINGLFSNILTLLSLADLGIGNVLIYSMYKPLANNDEEKMIELMSLYKKIYRIISIVVFSIGMVILPFVNVLINEGTAIPNIRFIYFLYLINTVVSYLCIYKISIINADQKNYIVVIIQQTINLIANVILIISLFITHNFIVYLVIQIAFSIFSNIIVSKKAEKMYPFIKKKNNEKLTHEEKSKIFKDTRAMVFHKVAGVVVNGTDNILMSSMINLVTVGIYSNYLLIINSIKRFTVLFFTSMSSSIGNLNVKESTGYTYDIFKKVFYGNFLIYTFSSICLLCLFNPFINIWLGESYVFDYKIVLLICMSFYVDGMRQTVLTFKDSMGLFQKDQIKPIIEAIANLLLSIVLTIKFGVAGIILGTVLSMLFVCVGTESYVLYKYGFKKDLKEYFKLYCKYLIIGIIVFLIVSSCIKLIAGTSFIVFCVKAIVTVFLTIILLIVLTCKTKEFKFYLNKVLKK